ncbi:unnamed protein product [Trypanosoma congolense IL3000]|uniref:WGS project CAEQ00000000 data, annotated contig 1201 n=1 Tax=Trypanosoma congolense (strain IL3000) TaxID=1068625 RepID=F9W4L5_TRYCI|nr:unnamed protein product [Trypanosoma congolense IL3000]
MRLTLSCFVLSGSGLAMNRPGAYSLRRPSPRIWGSRLRCVQADWFACHVGANLYFPHGRREGTFKELPKRAVEATSHPSSLMRFLARVGILCASFKNLVGVMTALSSLTTSDRRVFSPLFSTLCLGFITFRTSTRFSIGGFSVAPAPDAMIGGQL